MAFENWENDLLLLEAEMHEHLPADFMRAMRGMTMQAMFGSPIALRVAKMGGRSLIVDVWDLYYSNLSNRIREWFFICCFMGLSIGPPQWDLLEDGDSTTVIQDLETMTEIYWDAAAEDVDGMLPTLALRACLNSWRESVSAKD